MLDLFSCAPGAPIVQLQKFSSTPGLSNGSNVADISSEGPSTNIIPIHVSLMLPSTFTDAINVRLKYEASRCAQI